MPPIDDLIGWFFKVLFTGGMSFLLWGKKEDKKELKLHSRAITELQSKAVSEDKVREIIKDELACSMRPVREDISEIKDMVARIEVATHDNTIKIAKREGYDKAMREIRENAAQ